jgi:hypothetical protein
MAGFAAVESGTVSKHRLRARTIMHQRRLITGFLDRQKGTA